MAPTANKINSIPFNNFCKFHRILIFSYLLNSKISNDTEKLKPLTISLL